MRALLAMTLMVLAASPWAQDRVYRDTFAQPCLDLPGPLRASNVRTYRAHYGVEFGQQHQWIATYVSNTHTINPPGTERVRVDAYSFVAPEPSSGLLRTSSTMHGVIYSLSEQCGAFEAPPACQMLESSMLAWSTRPDAPAGLCRLEAGKPYYLSVAFFNFRAYSADANVIESSCERDPNCNSQTCTVTCNYHHMSSEG